MKTRSISLIQLNHTRLGQLKIVSVRGLLKALGRKKHTCAQQTTWQKRNTLKFGVCFESYSQQRVTQQYFYTV